MSMKFEVVPRSDDGSYDLFEKNPNGKLDFLSNHDSMDEVRYKIDSYKKPVSQAEMMQHFKSIEDFLKSI